MPFFALAAASIAQAAAPPADMHAPFDALLGAHVRAERVDYLTIRDEHFAELTGYLDTLAALDAKVVETLPKADRLALLINLYNATMVRTVCERYVDGWEPQADKFAVFDLQLVHFGGATLSLNELEHQRIRKVFAEPRVHVALVCAARSCPPLLPRAYRGDELEQVLEAQMRAFVRDPLRNHTGAGKLELSKIFEWYRDDFGKDEAALLRYLSRYAASDLAGRQVAFLDYSWQPNLAAPAAIAEWAVLPAATRAGGVQLRRGEVVRVLAPAAAGEPAKIRVPFGKGEATMPAADLKPFRAPADR